MPQVKAAFRLKICVSPGLLDLRQAQRLKQCGVDRVNHNLNTSQRPDPRICTTHTYEDRLRTLDAVAAPGWNSAAGGSSGWARPTRTWSSWRLRVGQLRAEAVPINFLIPIPGIPLAATAATLTPRYCLKVLALFRLANSAGELRIAAGRHQHLGSLQPLGLYAANSIFVGDYLTTKGCPTDEDRRMIESLGFEPVQ